MRPLYAKIFATKTYLFLFSSILKDLLLEFLFHIIIQFGSYKSCSYLIKLSRMTLLKWIHFIEKAPYILFYNTYSTPFT